MNTAVVPDTEFLKAVDRACLRAVGKAMRYDPFRLGDVTAVLHGATTQEIADEADLPEYTARRKLLSLHKSGVMLRDDVRGGRAAWWRVGLAPTPSPAPIAAPPPAPVPAQAAHAPRQPAPIPQRQHWADVLGVARDCSTSEVREAFKERLASVNDLDLDAEAQRQCIRDAYNTRLTEDGISELA